jgi:hypothetical protein
MHVPFTPSCHYDTGRQIVSGSARGIRGALRGFRAKVQGKSGMARKSSTIKTISDDVAKELEEALDIDLTLEDFEPDGISDLDIAASNQASIRCERGSSSSLYRQCRRVDAELSPEEARRESEPPATCDRQSFPLPNEMQRSSPLTSAGLAKA